MPAGLYIHIPFCVSKCAYCDFASYAGRSALVNPYLKALAKEAAANKTKLNPKTLYIGGGTPSFLNIKQIDFLCKTIESNFGKIKNFKEATFECNPESVTEAKIKLLKQYGFTRLSLGMQTLNDCQLKAIGRAHTAAQFFEAVKIIKKYFDNFSIDIIAALPGQTLADLKKTLQQTAALNPNHISVYGLQVEEGTKLYNSGYRADDALCLSMLKYAAKYLAAQGLLQYEISNFAKKGFESLHNINYWQSGQYLGLGAAAASYIKGARSANTADLAKYIKGKDIKEFSETLKGKAKEGERVLLALRQTKGLKPSKKALECFGKDFDTLIRQGLLIKAGANICLSQRGKYLANEVFRHFVEPF